MTIGKYINLMGISGKGKKHVLIIATPKGEYPTQFSREEYFNLEDSILKKPKSYIELFETDVPEIMQFTAFRMFLKPAICDIESLSNNSITKVKRLNKDEIESFIVLKHFYDTVRYGEKSEKEAIKDGLLQAESFLKKFPLSTFEFASVILTKDSDEANILIKLDFQNRNDNYYFDYVYVN